MQRHDCEQYSPEWWTIRRGIPTASEFPNIITPKTMKLAAAAESYCHRLVGDLLSLEYPPVQKPNGDMERGTQMEPESRSYYEMQRECDVEAVGFCTDDAGRFGCSPDGLIGDDGGLELKNPRPHTHVGWLLAGAVPDEYRAQVHGNLIVTGRKWWDFLSYCPGLPPLLVRVEPDDFTDKLRSVLEEFWTLYQGIRSKVEAMT